ncbi:MAG: hypothetical protein KBA75_04060 [Alphaproteobacteria bacterium]|nr:hypothetical protein [Alphaproteobacteria bacterium]
MSLYAVSVLVLTLLLGNFMPAAVHAAAPAHGASCSEFAANASACNTNGCFVCTSGNWVDQPLYLGAASITCDASHEGLHRYDSATHLPEVCNGSAWKTIAVTQPTSSPNAPAGSGYFVMTHTAWNGNLGGLSGADALCLTELGTTYTSWRGYSDANANGQITGSKVHAFLCDSVTCNSLLPSTSYYLAYANDSRVGGASFTTNGSGLGPGNAIPWSAANYFSGTHAHWSGRDSDPGTGVTPNLWTNRVLGNSYTTCDDWSNSSSGQTGTIGASANTDQRRWDADYATCDNSRRLICYVNPICSAVDSFSFTDLTNQTPNTLVTSNIVQITGGSCGGVSVSASAGGLFRICADAACSQATSWYSSGQSATAARGSYIQLEQTSSSTANTTATVTLTIESQTTDWHVTTEDYKLIFVTSTTSNGNLKGAAADGIAGANSTCNTRASSGSLPGTYKAWLATTAGNDPATLHSHASTPYRLPVNLTKVANNWTGLVSGTLLNAINRSESGTSVSNTNNVWSNADSSGTRVGSTNCTNWTSTSSGVSGAVGSSNATNTSWANNSTATCNTNKRLYCVQQ